MTAFAVGPAFGLANSSQPLPPLFRARLSASWLRSTPKTGRRSGARTLCPGAVGANSRPIRQAGLFQSQNLTPARRPRASEVRGSAASPRARQGQYKRARKLSDKFFSKPAQPRAAPRVELSDKFWRRAVFRWSKGLFLTSRHLFRRPSPRRRGCAEVEITDGAGLNRENLLRRRSSTKRRGQGPRLLAGDAKTRLLEPPFRKTGSHCCQCTLSLAR